MTSVNRTTLYTYFNTGDKPTEAQFDNLIDSALNLSEAAAQSITSDVSALGKLDVTGTLTIKGSSATSLTGNLAVTGLAALNAATGLTKSAADNSTNLATTGYVDTNAFVTKTAWVPVLAFGGASVGITYTSHTGKYVQIGKIIIAEFSIVLTSKGSSTGSATITGLPFSADAIGMCNLQQIGNTASNFASEGQHYVSGTTINLFYSAAGGGAALANTDFANTTTISGTAIYIIA